MGNESNLTMWQPITRIDTAPVDCRSMAGMAPCTSVLHDNTLELQQKTAALAETIAENFISAWREAEATACEAIRAFCEWLRKVAAEVLKNQELETALRWARCFNRPLYNRYVHTKKKRIRKKYEKRIMAWYRTEAAPCRN